MTRLQVMQLPLVSGLGFRVRSRQMSATVIPGGMCLGGTSVLHQRGAVSVLQTAGVCAVPTAAGVHRVVSLCAGSSHLPVVSRYGW